jgi:hypothetical protein
MMPSFTFYSDEKHRGVELYCDMCNSQWPQWYYRLNKNDVWPSYCICESCMDEIKWEMKS